MLTNAGELSARAAGGRLLFLTDCSVLADCPGAVAVDQYASTTYQNAHPLIADGTVLRGQPSGRTYAVAAGLRRSISDPGGAIDVNDATVGQIPDGDLPAPTPVLPAIQDADGDGVTAPLDCNEARADVHPGAGDLPGDGVDQDCNGTDAAYPKLELLVGAFFNTRGEPHDADLVLRARCAGSASRLTLRCTGGGCPFTRRPSRSRRRRRGCRCSRV